MKIIKQRSCLLCLSVLLFTGCSNDQPAAVPIQFEVPEMSDIPSGTFTMGQVLGDFRLGIPLHTVVISSNFKLGTYEISNAQYCQMLNYALLQGELAGDYKQNIRVQNVHGDPQVLLNLEADYKGYVNPIRFDGSGFVVSEEMKDLPVVYVTWYGAAFYCNMLGRSQGLEETYDLHSWSTNFGKGYRLPTEAEWEYAARYPDGRTFPWGNDFESLNDNANFGLNIGQLTDITRFEEGRSSLGLYNMIGNAEEWVNDFYSTYPTDTVTDPTGPVEGVYKQKRGGSFYKHDNNLPFIAYRYDTNYQYTYYFDIGFRICLNMNEGIINK